ncbi:hypothetical protein PUN28_014399 [Cardiocondyla obscurior]|uniref:Uncharacterized protein n=1 Tax=Cardiocondyla obscurior TaxID=286306 RepID=A0AAW2F178_9HYME
MQRIVTARLTSFTFFSRSFISPSDARVPVGFKNVYVYLNIFNILPLAVQRWRRRLSVAYVNSHFGLMKGNKKDGGERKRVMALFESEGSFVHCKRHYPFLPSVAREYAVRLKARKAIVAVERRAKKSPLSRSRSRGANSRILTLYSS